MSQWIIPPRWLFGVLVDTSGDDPVNGYTLESTAAHESLHILLADYRETVASKPLDEMLEAAEHRVIHTLERLLVPKPPESK